MESFSHALAASPFRTNRSEEARLIKKAEAKDWEAASEGILSQVVQSGYTIPVIGVDIVFG